MRIMLELLTEGGHFNALFIILLAFLSARNYIFNQLWPLNTLMDKLYECTSMSGKLRQYVNTWKP